MKSTNATAEVFYTAFKSLKNSEQTIIIEKIISDPELRAELFDVLLIEEAKKTKGKSISAKDYFAKRRKVEAA